MAITHKPPPPSRDPGLYEADHYAWLVRNASLIRAGRLTEADLEHVAKELEDLGRNEKRTLGNHLAVLLLHLLKWQFEPQHRSSTWRGSIYNARDAIRESLRESPSLRNRVPELVADRFGIVRYNAVNETGLPESDVPTDCPYSVEQLMDPDFLPGVPHDRQSGLKC